jgi:hypothetical protein
MVPVARHAAKSNGRPWWIAIAVVCVVIAGVAAALVLHNGSKQPAAGHLASQVHTNSTSTTTTQPTTTTTSTVPPAAAGFVAGRITAVGDSVMIDYSDPLKQDIPGVDIQAAVSRQWYEGVTLLQQLKAEGTLGAEVIVALSTNGPITDADFNNMMSVLQGASRVVIVNDHVDQPWQDPNNAVLASGTARFPHVVIADWATLAAKNPQWFASDGTHLAIDGPGAVALASLITSTLSGG